jgi:hypothetical protein
MGMNSDKCQFLRGNRDESELPTTLLYYNFVKDSVTIYNLNDNPTSNIVFTEHDLVTVMKFFEELK